MRSSTTVSTFDSVHAIHESATALARAAGSVLHRARGERVLQRRLGRYGGKAGDVLVRFGENAAASFFLGHCRESFCSTSRSSASAFASSRSNPGECPTRSIWFRSRSMRAARICRLTAASMASPFRVVDHLNCAFLHLRPSHITS
jgi:hypothetical protein